MSHHYTGIEKKHLSIVIHLTTTIKRATTKIRDKNFVLIWDNRVKEEKKDEKV